jgi:hypothetical protein
MGTVNTNIPNGYIYGPESQVHPDFSGNLWESPWMYEIAKHIDDVMLCFNHLQEGLSLPQHVEPRYARFFKHREEGIGTGEVMPSSLIDASEPRGG